MFRAPALFLCLLPAVAFTAELDFQRDVRPILSNHCYHCHGPDEQSRKGGLRLDIREEALKPGKSGEIAILPGQADKSEIIQRIFTHDEDDLMPPVASKKPITLAQKDILKRWVTEGANYAPHWAFSKPVAAPVPAGKHPVDHFIQQKLAEQGLSASPSANPRTLARRVSLDLTGLPPTAEKMENFITAWNSGSHDEAYAAYVDKLLVSPAYGERWARRWLDLARYADTNGYEKDRERSIWPYRDWVIQALNADMPFDQFTIEQLAGDMLPQATLDQRIATGFHRNTMLNEEGGIDPLEFRFHAMTDRVATTGATWLGLTLQCAQCHTHKFDPITHTEYYGIMAFLNNADEPDLDLPDPAHLNQERENQKQAAELLKKLPEKWPNKEGVLGIKESFVAWLKEEQGKVVSWQTLKPVRADTNLVLLTPQPDGSLLGSGDITKSDTYDLTLASSNQPISALRLEVLPHESLPAHGPGMCNYEGPKGDFFMGEIKILADGKPVKITSATEGYSKNNFGKDPANAMQAADGDPQTGWSCAGRYGERHEAVFVLDQPIPTGAKIQVQMLFGRHYGCPLGHFRLSASSDAKAVARAMEDPLTAVLKKTERSPAEEQSLWEYFLLTTPHLAESAKAIVQLRKPLIPSTTLVMKERPANHPRPTHRHHRGEFTQPQEAVQPLTLAALHPFPEKASRTRLEFARWIVSPENPLTARVIMNRQWATSFGRGLVKTVDDFGYQGSLPSHPELLDWLAVEFIKQGWSLKKMHRLIVTSATYRQASSVQPTTAAQDPENIWLSHFPNLRLEAEMLRDSMLQASGLLNQKLGGPSVYPPQPDSVTEVAYGKYKWTPSTDSSRYRRSLYTFSKRTAPFALYTTFDAPPGDLCLVKRESSNSALQALTLLNDIIFTEGAQALGKLLSAEKGDDAAKIRSLYLRVLNRPPEPDEIKIMQHFISQQRERVMSGELKSAEIAASTEGNVNEAAVWILASRALLNLDEFITKG